MRFRVITTLFTMLMLIGFFPAQLHAQLVVQTNLTPEQLVQQVLVGGGVAVSNVTYQGNNFMHGSFSNGHSTNLGLDEGVVLSSGNVMSIPNPASVFASASYGLPGDPTLNTITTNATHDASVLEFDFVPTADTLRFKYVFGSEEYNEWVGATYNDVFGFFVNGPKPNGLGSYVNFNVALIPGTSLPVSINNVNANSYSQFYINNEVLGGTTIVYDGFTVVLTALLVVVPCEQYHIKLAIADAGDGAYDSGVFLEANSFSSSGPSTNMTFSNSSNLFGAAVEACNDAQITFQLDELRNEDYYIVRQQSIGTATLDVDYGLSPSSDTLWIPAGSLSTTLTLFPYSDDLVEGTETAEFIFEYAEGCDPTNDTTVVEILDNTTAIPAFGLQSEFCYDDDPVELSGAPPGGVFSGPGVAGNVFYPNQANSGYNEIYYTIYFIDHTAFGTDTICMNDVMNAVWVYGNPDVHAGPDAIIAEGQTFTPESSAQNYDFVEWTTSGTGTFNDINIVAPVYTPSIQDIAAGNVTLSIYAEAHAPCEGDSADSMVLTMVSGTTALAGDDDAICEGMVYQLNGDALFYNTLEWETSGDGAFSDPSLIDPIYTPGPNDVLNGGVVLTLNAYGSSVHSDEMYLSIGPKPLADPGPNRLIPHGIWITLESNVTGGSGQFLYIWEPSEMLENPTSPNPQTLNIYEDITFTLYVTDAETGCESEAASVNVIIDGDPLDAATYSEPGVSCAGGNVQLFANPLGGAGVYEDFVWTAPGGQTYAFENPIVEIVQPSTFTLEFSDGYNTFSSSLFIDLLPDPVIQFDGETLVLCIFEEISLDAGNPGSTYLWSTGDTTQIITLATTGLAYEEQLITLEVENEYGCRGNASATVIFDYDACVGIDETDLSGNFNIYPNPSYGLFNIAINGLQGEMKMHVYGATGILMLNKSITISPDNFLYALNLSHLPDGMYFIRFVHEHFVHSEKIIIK